MLLRRTLYTCLREDRTGEAPVPPARSTSNPFTLERTPATL